MSERAVRIAATYYDARDSLRTILGDEYAARVAPWREVVRGAVRRFGCAEVMAPVRVVQDLRERGQNVGGIEVAYLLAATVEEVEEQVSAACPGTAGGA